MNIKCAICLERITELCEVLSTPCGHLFHSNCLKRSIERNNSRPQCRESCSKQVRVHRVYFSIESNGKIWKLLQSAAELGSLEWYKRITEDDENKNPTNLFGRTPLHYAAKTGQMAICNFIMQNIEEKNPKDEHGKTPIDFAAENGQLDTCFFDA